MGAPVFPTISGGSVSKYPVTRSNVRRGGIHIFTDFSEQRFAQGNPLTDFELNFNNIPTADKDAIRAFWIARRGTFDTTWSLTINDPTTGGATTYTNMQFTPGQQFEPTEESTGLWSFKLRIRQTRGQI